MVINVLSYGAREFHSSDANLLLFLSNALSCSMKPSLGSVFCLWDLQNSRASSSDKLNLRIRYMIVAEAERDFPMAQWTRMRLVWSGCSLFTWVTY